MARTRWPPGPVNPGLWHRPGRSDRQRRWVPKNWGPADRSISRQPKRRRPIRRSDRTQHPTLRPHHRRTPEAGPKHLSTSSLPIIRPLRADAGRWWRRADYLFGGGQPVPQTGAVSPHYLLPVGYEHRDVRLPVSWVPARLAYLGARSPSVSSVWPGPHRSGLVSETAGAVDQPVGFFAVVGLLIGESAVQI